MQICLKSSKHTGGLHYDLSRLVFTVTGDIKSPKIRSVPVKEWDRRGGRNITRTLHSVTLCIHCLSRYWIQFKQGADYSEASQMEPSNGPQSLNA
jgi:hypothetical protein